MDALISLIMSVALAMAGIATECASVPAPAPEPVIEQAESPEVFEVIDETGMWDCPQWVLDEAAGYASPGDVIVIIDSAKRIESGIMNRVGSGKIIIDRCVGTVLNDEGDGALDGFPEDHNYISYAHMDFPVSVGDRIVTFGLYNPENNYEDDIIARWDFKE